MGLKRHEPLRPITPAILRKRKEAPTFNRSSQRVRCSTFGIPETLSKQMGSSASTRPLQPRRGFIAEDGGFTSVGVVIALLLVVALLFSAAQVKWITSTSADIQFVADSGALAAQNLVAEYEIIAHLADAVVLSFSLFGMAVFGIAIVVSCIPGLQGVGLQLMEFGTKVFSARDDIAKQATNALNALQRALPFLCAANAARVINSNQISPQGTEHYIGFAIPLPLTGKDISYPDDDEAQASADELEQRNAETAEMTDAAQRAYEKMQQSKLEGYLADCGYSPNYCLYERADRLSAIQGGQNPYFSSVDTWLFDYAFDRSLAYYRDRLANEHPDSATLEDQVRSFARTRFYTFAVSEMQRGYAHTNEDGTLDAYFPLLPKNNDELRRTSLYTEQVYPVSADGVAHGSPHCSAYQSAGAAGYGSVAQCENGTYTACSHCDFSINTIGRVGSPSSTIDNGFEYHYRKVAEAAERYQQAAREYQEHTSQAQESAEGSFDVYEEALNSLAAPRLHPRPPGRNGCIAIVIDASTHQIPSPFSSTLVGGSASLQPRVAISAAAMAADEAVPGDTVIASFLDRIQADSNFGSIGDAALGTFDGVLTVWGDMLLAYSNGVDSMSQGVGDFLRSIPVVRSTPLASWAESSLRDIITAFGLQGVNLSTPKPVLVNTMHVARAADSSAADALAALKEMYSSIPGSGSGALDSFVIDGLLEELESQGVGLLESEFTLFTISFGDIPGLPEIPIKVSLPTQLIEYGREALSDTRSSLGTLLGEEG